MENFGLLSPINLLLKILESKQLLAFSMYKKVETKENHDVLVLNFKIIHF
jgi:hypothetical protein